MSDKGVVLTPISKSPNFDAIQVMNFDNWRCTKLTIASGGSATLALEEDTELVKIRVHIDTDDERPFVEMTRTAIAAETWPLDQGVHDWGVVGGYRLLSFAYAGTGSATIHVMEA
ncbi:hypothetical protein HFO32_22160 [Rhizobium leguminosarum]|uniref:hypothetical protein n=1 Tax=Rhizobium leguminosarum TaxID=384 RepID=UPI001C969C24|nr:hypothetical protein [Rhizobium leguminosarum]MBY5684830.1 hypothetical protein [Rhizobium leguminosarum]